jgi:hypothetical protein
MKDLDKLSKSELKKLQKKDKKKKKKKEKKKVKAKTNPKKKHVSITHNQNISDKMIEQKPIITRTNPLQQVQQFIPQGFGGSATIDQRNNDILRGQFNETSNKLIKVENILGKERTEAQLQGDIDKRNTGKARRHIKEKLADDDQYKTLGKQRMDNTMKNVFSAWKNYHDDEKIQQSIPIQSNSLNRDTYSDPEYFNPYDGIDVASTEPVLTDPTDYSHMMDSDTEDEDEIIHNILGQLTNKAITGNTKRVNGLTKSDAIQELNNRKKTTLGKYNKKRLNVGKKNIKELRNLLIE